MKTTATILFSFVMLFSISNQSFAGGFQINEHSARAMGMAGAFTGLANDASAVYFNPAGITQLTGTNFLAGITLIAPSAKFTGPTPLTTESEMESQLFTPFNFYVTHQFSKSFHAGLGVNNQFGLGTKWEEKWPGRYLAVDTEIRSFFFTPVIAYAFSDQFSISAGALISIADVTIIRMNRLEDPVTKEKKPDAKVDMEGDGNAFGFTAGILFKPSKQFSVGASYRSEMKFDFEGTLTTTPPTLDFTHPLAGPQSVKLPAGDVKAPLTAPQNLSVGIAFMPSDELSITADFQYIGWSSYDSLKVNAENFYFDPPTNTVKETSVGRKYENTFIIRAGAEYLISDIFTIRGGVLYDRNPVQDEYVEPTLPDANRIGINVGFGYKFSKNFHIDVAYLLLTFSERIIDNSKFGFNGTYKNLAHLFGVNLAYGL